MREIVLGIQMRQNMQFASPRVTLRAKPARTFSKEILPAVAVQVTRLIGRDVTSTATADPTENAGQIPPHCKSESDRRLYSKIIANLPSEEDLALIATIPTPEWTAEKDRMKRQ